MKLGTHLNKGSGFVQELNTKKKLFSDYGLTYGAAQIFVMGPRNTKFTLSQDDKDFFKSNANIELIVHGSYLDHIMGKNPNFTAKLVGREQKIVSEIGALGLVIHIPERPPEEVAAAINLLPKFSKVLLEINTYRHNYNYTDINLLKKLFSLINRKVGLVVDTAHLWASGVKINTYEGAKKWLSELDEKIFDDVYFHLNDQTWPFKSGNDKHCPLTTGTIWEEYGINGVKDICNSGLAAFAKWANKHSSVVIFEEANNAALMTNLIIFKGNFL